MNCILHVLRNSSEGASSPVLVSSARLQCSSPVLVSNARLQCSSPVLVSSARLPWNIFITRSCIESGTIFYQTSRSFKRFLRNNSSSRSIWNNRNVSAPSIHSCPRCVLPFTRMSLKCESASYVADHSAGVTGHFTCSPSRSISYSSVSCSRPIEPYTWNGSSSCARILPSVHFRYLTTARADDSENSIRSTA